MSGALRHHQLLTMGRVGWTTIKVVCDLPRLREFNTTMGDLRLIANGDGDNRKRRFELSDDGRCIRCTQGRSAGSVVRPDAMPVETNIKYLIHGTSLQAARQLVKEGLSKCSRSHIHFYECDRRGVVTGSNGLRYAAEVGIVALATHCMEDGIVFRRAPNDVILTDGINGILGPQYIRFVCAIPRDQYALRRVVWEKSNHVWNIPEAAMTKQCRGGQGLRYGPQSSASTVITRPDEHDITSDEDTYEHTLTPLAADSDDDCIITELAARLDDQRRIEKPPPVNMKEIVGLNPFSDSEQYDVTAKTRSEDHVSWETGGSDSEVRSECNFG